MRLNLWIVLTALKFFILITSIRHVSYGHHQQATGSMVSIRHLHFSYACPTFSLAFAVFERASIFIVLLPANMLPPVHHFSIPPWFISLLKQVVMILNNRLLLCLSAVNLFWQTPQRANMVLLNFPMWQHQTSVILFPTSSLDCGAPSYIPLPGTTSTGLVLSCHQS